MFIKVIINVALSLILAGSLIQCQSTKKAENSSSWPEKMQGMSKAVSGLIPYIYSRKAFYDPQNAKEIKKQIVMLDKSIHSVPKKMGEKLIGEDPIIKYSFERLNDDVERASSSFDKGHKEYARSLLRGSISNCFSCHSRTQFGPEFSFQSSQFNNLKLQPSEKADLFVATRQYDKAIDVLQAKLNDPINFHEDPYELERALKKYLSIMVRVKKDPSTSINTVKKFLNRKSIPYYLEEDARRWEKSLNTWVGEKAKKTDPVTQAKSLIRKGKNLQGGFSHQSGHIEYLRATSLLHDGLREAKKGKDRAEIYYLLGESYEVLSDLGFWNFPELYYEACIRELPGSQLAKECYKDFERNVIFGFSGSAGIFIPADEKARLDELKKTSGLKD